MKNNLFLNFRLAMDFFLFYTLIIYYRAFSFFNKFYQSSHEISYRRLKLKKKQLKGKNIKKKKIIMDCYDVLAIHFNIFYNFSCNFIHLIFRNLNINYS
jgi:hypothetical protein